VRLPEDDLSVGRRHAQIEERDGDVFALLTDVGAALLGREPLGRVARQLGRRGDAVVEPVPLVVLARELLDEGLGQRIVGARDDHAGRFGQTGLRLGHDPTLARRVAPRAIDVIQRRRRRIPRKETRNLCETCRKTSVSRVI